MELEEEYEMVISNYIDLEKESLDFAMLYMLRTPVPYVDTFDARLALNRRLMNLLTSVRLYTDRLTDHCRACLPKQSAIKEKVKSLLSTEYDNNFDFRFMEALRNYIQHRGTPVHQVIFGGRGVTLDTDRLLEFSSSFSVYKKVLASDRHFKQQILDEMPDNIDLISASRGYIESLSSIHNNIRHLISKTVNASRLPLQKAIDDYKSFYTEEFWGLTAYAFDGNTKIDEIPIFLNRDDIRVRLQQRNNPLSHLQKSFVTGRTKKQ